MYKSIHFFCFFMKTDILAFYQDYSIFPLKKLFLSYVTGVNRSFYVSL